MSRTQLVLGVIAQELARLSRRPLLLRWGRFADQLQRWERHPQHVRGLFEDRLDYYSHGERRV